MNAPMDDLRDILSKLDVLMNQRIAKDEAILLIIEALNLIVEQLPPRPPRGEAGATLRVIK
jgi:hypothetical protein